MGATASWNLLEAIQRCREVLACEAFVAYRAIRLIEKPSSTCVESLIRCMNNVVLPGIEDRNTSEEIRAIAAEFTSSSWLSVIQSMLETPLRKSL